MAFIVESEIAFSGEGRCYYYIDRFETWAEIVAKTSGSHSTANWSVEAYDQPSSTNKLVSRAFATKNIAAIRAGYNIQSAKVVFKNDDVTDDEAVIHVMESTISDISSVNTADYNNFTGSSYGSVTVPAAAESGAEFEIALPASIYATDTVKLCFREAHDLNNSAPADGAKHRIFLRSPIKLVFTVESLTPIMPSLID